MRAEAIRLTERAPSPPVGTLSTTPPYPLDQPRAERDERQPR